VHALGLAARGRVGQAPAGMVAGDSSGIAFCIVATSAWLKPKKTTSWLADSSE